MQLDKEFVCKYQDAEVYLYKVKTRNEFQVNIMNVGAAITDIFMKDKDGVVENILATLKHKKDLIGHSNYYGMTIGRTSGRLYPSNIPLGSSRFELSKKGNKQINHLHGGIEGFSHKVFDMDVETIDNGIKLICHYNSKDMEEGYPGNLDVKVVYTIKEEDTLRIDYYANTDQTTLCNVTNHAYFNLSGNTKSTILDHMLQIHADSFYELDDAMVPIKKKSVEHTPLDFRLLTRIGNQIDHPYLQYHPTKGLDHPYMLSGDNESAVVLYDVVSRRKLELYTSYPSVVVYSYNYANKEQLTHKLAEKYDGICFECQFPPNGIHLDEKHQAILHPNEQYHEFIEYRFLVE